MRTTATQINEKAAERCWSLSHRYSINIYLQLLQCFDIKEKLESLLTENKRIRYLHKTPSRTYCFISSLEWIKSMFVSVILNLT